MKTLSIIAITLVAALTFTACGSKNKVQSNIDNRPEFVKKPPVDTDEYLFETGTGGSVRMATAEEKAFLDASTKMARKLEQRIDAMQKSFTEEISSGNNANSNYVESFTSVKKSITSASLQGLSKVESAMMPNSESGGYQAYTLVRYPVGAAAELLNNALSREEELYIKFKESKAFKELQEEIERYRKDN